MTQIKYLTFENAELIMKECKQQKLKIIDFDYLKGVTMRVLHTLNQKIITEMIQSMIIYGFIKKVEKDQYKLVYTVH